MLDRLVGDEPVVPPAAPVPLHAARVRPAGDVAFVRVGDADGKAIDRHVAGAREMKDVFVAIGEVALGVDRLEMAHAQFVGPPGLDGHRFDPVDGILQAEEVLKRQDELVREQRIRRRCTDVEEERSVGLEHAADFRRPAAGPFEVVRARGVVAETRVADIEIVGRRSDDDIDRFGGKIGHTFEAIAEMKIEAGGQAIGVHGRG
ncbi:MAG: hypothetical protein WDN28_05370 [Chthoniobacter sp.]